MAVYKLDGPGESVEAAFRRIAISQIDEALAVQPESDTGGRTAVHEARRRCKKLRGLLKLVRPAFPGYAAENAAVRDAASRLSGSRDAEVLHLVLARLVEQHPEQVDAVERVAAKLDLSAAPEAGPGLLAQFSIALGAVRERAAGWTLIADGADAVLPGLRRTYRTARRKMRKARRTQLPADLHDWRKACKTHGFHLDLARRLAPDVLADELGRMERLSDLLGEHHDLSLLDSVLADEPDLRVIVTGRMTELAEAAFALGEQVLAEPPRQLRARFALYWAAAK